MSRKKEKPIVLSELTKEEKMKYEIAEELGLLDKVMEQGWKSLSSKETENAYLELENALNSQINKKKKEQGIH